MPVGHLLIFSERFLYVIPHLLWIFFFVGLAFVSTLHILDINPLSYVLNENIFTYLIICHLVLECINCLVLCSPFIQILLDNSCQWHHIIEDSFEV